MECKYELLPATVLKLVSFMFWGWVYLWSSVKWPRQSPEWWSRIVTLLHGSVATLVGFSQCKVLHINTWRLTMPITPYHYALMVWSWGYFAFDLLWCLVYWTESALMLCHHVSALVAITVYMQKDNTGCTYACTVAMLEVTNPLLQTRWFLRKGGYNRTVTYFIVEVTYLVMFLTVRGVIFTYIMYNVVKSDILDMEEKIISVVFYLVSLAFIKDIVEYIFYRYKKMTAFRDSLEDLGLILNEER